jgi:hypothetical protein
MHQSPGSFSVSSRLGQAGCVIQFWEVCAEEEAAAAMGMDGDGDSVRTVRTVLVCGRVENLGVG